MAIQTEWFGYDYLITIPISDENCYINYEWLCISYVLLYHQKDNWWELQLWLCQQAITCAQVYQTRNLINYLIVLWINSPIFCKLGHNCPTTLNLTTVIAIVINHNIDAYSIWYRYLMLLLLLLLLLLPSVLSCNPVCTVQFQHTKYISLPVYKICTCIM